MNDSPIIRVRDVMVPELITVGRMETVRNAIATMAEKRVSSLVVERRDDDDEYGLLVVSDIAEKVVGQERSPDRVNVFEIMTKPVLTVPEDMQIKYAVRLLSKFGVSRALVLDDHRHPVGIVTVRDMVLKSIAMDQE